MIQPLTCPLGTHLLFVHYQKPYIVARLLLIQYNQVGASNTRIMLIRETLRNYKRPKYLLPLSLSEPPLLPDALDPPLPALDEEPLEPPLPEEPFDDLLLQPEYEAELLLVPLPEWPPLPLPLPLLEPEYESC